MLSKATTTISITIIDHNHVVFADANHVVQEVQQKEESCNHLQPLQTIGIPYDNNDSEPILLDEIYFDDIIDHSSTHRPIFHSSNSVHFGVGRTAIININIHHPIKCTLSNKSNCRATNNVVVRAINENQRKVLILISTTNKCILSNKTNYRTTKNVVV